MTLEEYFIPANTMHEDDASSASASETDEDSCSESGGSNGGSETGKDSPDSSCSSGPSASAWGAVLVGALRRAARQGRLTCGVAAAARVLERRPGSVRLCVLTPPGQGLLHLHSVLLEAHCYENDIPTITVDCVKKLTAIVGPSSECVLVHGPEVSSVVPRKFSYSAAVTSEGSMTSQLGERGLLAAARDGEHPSVVVLPVSPPP